MPGPGERRGVGVFEELFPEVFRTVDDELVVLEDAVVDFDREEDVALVGVADYDRNLAPLPGLDPGDLLAEFSGDTGVGEGAAKQFAEEYARRPYETVEDIADRGKVNKSAIDELRQHGVLDGLPETAQISLFG